MDNQTTDEQDKPVINDVVSNNQVAPNATSRPLVVNSNKPTAPDPMVNKPIETLKVNVATAPVAPTAPLTPAPTITTSTVPAPTPTSPVAPTPAASIINEVKDNPATHDPVVHHSPVEWAEEKEHKILLLVVFVVLLTLIAVGIVIIKLNKQ